MTIHIHPVGQELLAQYAQIPISFWVNSILRIEVIDHELGGFRLVEEPVAQPY